MTEKVKIIEQLNFYVDIYNNENKYQDGEIHLCGLFNNGIQVGSGNNIFKIAKHLEVTAEIKDRHSEVYKKEAFIVYRGVRFFAVGNEEDFENGGKEDE